MNAAAVDGGNDATLAGSSGDGRPPWGHYALSAGADRLRRYAGSQPDTYFGRRRAFLARRFALALMGDRADVVVFDHRLRIMPHANLAEKRVLFTPQYFDETERSILARVMPQDAVFLDIGANVGAYSFYVASLTGPQARIIAIEPQPAIFERLIDNIGFNPGAPIEALPLAIADVESTVRLFVDNSNAGETSMRRISKGSVDSGTADVPAKPLMQVVRDLGLSRIDGLKVDVEGAEDLVLVPFLQEAPEAILPRVLVMENSPDSWQTDCVTLAMSKGYRTVSQTRLNLVLCLPDTLNA